MELVMVPPPFAIANGSISGLGSSAPLYNHDPGVYVFPDSGSAAPGLGRVQGLTSPSSFVYDPLADYLEWHGMNCVQNCYSLNESEINYKLWDRSELNSWMSSNLTGVVLIQRVFPMWSLYFATDKDYLEFTNWWMNVRRNTVINIDIPDEYDNNAYACIKDVKAWCELNLKDRYELNNRGRYVECIVKDDAEAVLLKLRWTTPTN